MEHIMKKILILLPMIMALTACGDPSVADMVADESLLKKTMNKCSKMSLQELSDSELCRNASKANIERMKKSVIKAVK
jgi:hypothetical protein|tara:strand:+ start:456 stop:689 length:234 start_codon:yes stop_codon:yes gene_type:complete